MQKRKESNEIKKNNIHVRLQAFSNLEKYDRGAYKVDKKAKLSESPQKLKERLKQSKVEN
ncbi:hypothetical protein RZE82_07180 [Mollicutes bacterium LVI A0039]|nr:hypothetical protein RZE82_07180 [Mollicutes bacterium LVI A0039]